MQEYNGEHEGTQQDQRAASDEEAERKMRTTPGRDRQASAGHKRDTGDDEGNTKGHR
jgi:hypothetical protein